MKSEVNQVRNAFASAVPAMAGEFFENPSENASTIFSFLDLLHDERHPDELVPRILQQFVGRDGLLFPCRARRRTP